MSTYKFGQSALVVEAWNFLSAALIFLLQDFLSGASYYKSPDDAVDLLHRAYYEQQELNLVIGQSWLSALPRSSGCL